MITYKGLFTHCYNGSQYGIVERYIKDLFILARYVRILEVSPSGDITVKKMMFGNFDKCDGIRSILFECCSILSVRHTVEIESNCEETIWFFIGVITRFILERSERLDDEFKELCDVWAEYSCYMPQHVIDEIYDFDINLI